MINIKQLFVLHSLFGLLNIICIILSLVLPVSSSTDSSDIWGSCTTIGCLTVAMNLRRNIHLNLLLSRDFSIW
jgi:hypothetical protein